MQWTLSHLASKYNDTYFLTETLKVFLRVCGVFTARIWDEWLLAIGKVVCISQAQEGSGIGRSLVKRQWLNPCLFKWTPSSHAPVSLTEQECQSSQATYLWLMLSLGVRKPLENTMKSMEPSPEKCIHKILDITSQDSQIFWNVPTD